MVTVTPPVGICGLPISAEITVDCRVVMLGGFAETDIVGVVLVRVITADPVPAT
jgi:hypothetical protein